MKILLIVPPRDYHIDFDIIERSQNLSLWYLSSFLHERGVDVDIFDMQNTSPKSYTWIDNRIVRIGASFSRVKKKLEESKPQIIGITCLSSTQHQATIDLSHFIKKIDSNVLLAVGGNHATFMSEKLLEDSKGSIDIVAIGEGESTLYELCSRYQDKCDIHNLEGIAFIKNGKYCINKPRPLIEQSALPILLPEKYEATRKAAIKANNKSLNFSCEVMFSRGCVYNCSFCTSPAMWKRKLRIHSDDSITLQLKRIKEYGYKHLLVEDDDFLNLTKNSNILKLIRDFGFTWQNNGGINIEEITEQDIASFAKSGCKSVSAPINLRTFDETSLLKKKMDIIEQNFSLLSKYNIDSVSFIILGYPNQTLNEMEKAIEFGKLIREKHNVKYIFLLAFSLLPGTAWTQHCDANNCVSYDKYWWPGYSLYTPQVNTEHICTTELGELLHSGMRRINSAQYDNFFKPLMAKNVVSNAK